MAFRPLHDRVLVRRIEAEEKTAGGIIIPDSAKEKPSEGEIVSTGSGAKAEDGTVTPLDVKAGDRVLFGKWSGTEVKIDGEDLLIMIGNATGEPGTEKGEAHVDPAPPPHCHPGLDPGSRLSRCRVVIV